MQRVGIFIYGLIAYGIGLLGQIWFIFYISDWKVLEMNIYAPQSTALWESILINTLLVLLFGVQHSMMARDWFKRWLTKFIPIASERSTYVLFSGLAFIVLCFYWKPIDGYLWQVESGWGYYLLSFGFVFGWSFSVLATFVINHFELFGLQQVYLNLRNKSAPTIAFQERFFYKFIRHPIQLGVLIGLWFTPAMSYGHLLLSLLFTLYIFIGLHFEEKDLIKDLGEVYRAYQKRVGLLFPLIKRS